MKNKFLTLGLTGLILGGLLFIPQEANAYRGNPAVKGPYYSEERHAAMEKAFDSNDYNAWINLMNGRGRVTQVINKDNFSKFSQIHRLMEQGKIEEAKKIRTELGLGLRNGSGFGMWKNK